MAQDKMLYVFQGKGKGVQDTKRSNTPSSGRNSKINKITGKLKDNEVSSITWGNYSSRWTILASSNCGPNKYRFIVVPTQCLDGKTSSIHPQIVTKYLDMSTTFPAGSLKLHEPQILGESITDVDSSGDSVIHRCHKIPQSLHLCVECSINDESNWRVLPFSSCCSNPSISIEYPLGLSRWPNTTSSAHRYISDDDFIAVQRNSKRETCRRGKCNGLSRTCSSAELNSENGFSRSEDDKTKDMCTVSISMPCLREPDSRINQNAVANDKCSFMVDMSKSELLDDGNGSIYNSSVTCPEFCNSLLAVSSSRVSDYATSTVHHSDKPSNEEDDDLGVLKLECYNDEKDLLFPEDTPHIYVEPPNLPFRNNGVRQVNDGDGTSRSLEKKEYQSRKFPHNSSVKRQSSLGNLNMNYGKDITHSIWRKVQRNDVDAHNCNSNAQPTNLVPSQLKAPKKPRKRKVSRANQELHSTCKVESHGTNGCSSVCSSTDMKKTSLSSSRQNLASYGSRSSYRKNSGAIFQVKKLESMTYKPLHKPEAVIPVLLSESPNVNEPEVVLDVSERQNGLPPQQRSFHDTPDIHKEDSFIDDNIKMMQELPATDYCKEKHTTILAEKHVNPGLNNCRGRNLGTSSLPLEALRSLGSPCLMSEDESSIKKSETMNTSTPEISCNNTATNGLTCEYKNPVLFASPSAMVNVSHAVNDAYRVQLASEAIQLITGSPIAEFEEFVYSASPVLYAQDINNCKKCLPYYGYGDPLCQHETPNLSLGNIWRWYEKHGACGMEVRSKDCEHSVRFGMDQFAFRAYFVPYLSAVQLFRKCKSHPNDDTYVYIGETVGSNEGSSTDGLASILQKLGPQPCSVNSSTFSKKSHVPHKEVFFASMNNKIDDEQSDLRLTGGVDLLFEYFEYEQPQQRRPLFEMIKELSSGHAPIKSRLVGDPSSLESLSLNDLHPNSWYSVAWYPIYRIPEGKLRAAFLTYHSLGHLIRRRPKHGSHSVDVSIVSPVVGLQCYSAQGECWFNPRQPTEHKQNGVMDLDLSHVLKERIRTLEHTASVMARATVTAGSQTYVNRQPDYEFFLSRRR